MSELILKAITCHQTQEAIDEPYLRVTVGDNSWIEWGPASMNDGETQVINRRIHFDSWIAVELWERDQHRDNQIGGAFRFHHVRDLGEDILAFPEMRHMGRFGAAYTLSYEVVEDDAEPEHSHSLTLVSLECNDAQEREDTVYLIVNDRQVWGPIGMRTGSTSPINILLIDLGNLLRVELWESDGARSDCFGTMFIEDLTSLDEDDLNRVLPHQFHRDRGIGGDATYILRYAIERVG
jgi:hypothetical protein